MRYAETHRIRGSVLVEVYYTDLGIKNETRMFTSFPQQLGKH